MSLDSVFRSHVYACMGVCLICTRMPSAHRIHKHCAVAVPRKLRMLGQLSAQRIGELASRWTGYDCNKLAPYLPLTAAAPPARLQHPSFIWSTVCCTATGVCGMRLCVWTTIARLASHRPYPWKLQAWKFVDCAASENANFRWLSLCIFALTSIEFSHDEKLITKNDSNIL